MVPVYARLVPFFAALGLLAMFAAKGPIWP